MERCAKENIKWKREIIGGNICYVSKALIMRSEFIIANQSKLGIRKRERRIILT